MSHGRPVFFIRISGSLLYMMTTVATAGSFCFPVPPGVHEEMVPRNPNDCFKHAKSARAPSGLVGVFLDISEFRRRRFAGMLEEAFRCAGPRGLLQKLGDERMRRCSKKRRLRMAWRGKGSSL